MMDEAEHRFCISVFFDAYKLIMNCKKKKVDVLQKKLMYYKKVDVFKKGNKLCILRKEVFFS